MQRPDWDEIWLEVAEAVASRSLCVRAQVCAVIVDTHHRMVSTGYNGPPAGFDHWNAPCDQWCNRASYPDVPGMHCASVHAEANALIASDRSRWQGGTMYVTKHPCWECAKLIANSGLDRLVVKPSKPTPDGHHSEGTYDFLEECGITVEVVEYA
ncbi:MAG: dCMP deaminase family protein [Actinobacteria bacterium]|nr:dCMP deaminase family protein [Actinomycetota bacterium]